jgi:hypothetical protein
MHCIFTALKRIAYTHGKKSAADAAALAVQRMPFTAYSKRHAA